MKKKDTFFFFYCEWVIRKYVINVLIKYTIYKDTCYVIIHKKEYNT